ncbi:hypothetical protein GF327_00645 [Candidatus Woesearchaeota archaeon]|nr:hypothetical protein [Candidatus Woesearchaeota archaeon]
MWSARLSWKHDCLIGNRCKKFGVEVIGFPIGFYRKGNKLYYSHVESVRGKKEKIKKFQDDLENDPRINEFESQSDTVFFSYSVDKEIPTAHQNQKIFFFKPVYVDKKGYEHWEIASWKKAHINEFIKKTRKDADEFIIKSIKKTKIDEIYFPRFIPKLTNLQKKAIELASENGYYDYPRKTELNDLAEKMDISLSTYRQHLRVAEKKLIPELLSVLLNKAHE